MPGIRSYRWAWCLLAIVAALGLTQGDARTGPLVMNTLKLALATALVGVPLGTWLALLVTRSDLPGRAGARVLLCATLLVPLYLQACAWQAGLGTEGWNTLVRGAPVWLDGWRGAILVHGLAAIPWVVLIVASALTVADPDLEEDAALDATRSEVLRRVTLRRVVHAVLAAALWVAITCAGEMTVTDLFQVRTYAEEVYTDIAAEPGETPLGVVSGVGMTALAVLGAMLLVAKIAPTRHPPTRRAGTISLGAWRWPMFGLVTLALVVLWGLPVANLLWKAGTSVIHASHGVEREWSVLKAMRLMARSGWDFRRHIQWSLITAFVAATMALMAAFPLAWWARRGGRGAIPAWLVSSTCVAVPGPIVGLCIIWLMNSPRLPWLNTLYDRSILPVCLAQMVRGLPLAILVLWHALASLPEETLESAALDGASLWTRCMRIALAQRKRAVALAWLAAWIVALGEVSATILVLPPGVETLSSHIFNLLHYGVDDRVAGACLAQMALFMLIILCAQPRTTDWRVSH